MQLVVGRVGRAHGIRGEVAVEVRTDDPAARFAPGAILLTEPALAGPLVVESSREHSGRLLVTFEGVPDRTAAEALRGTVLLVDVDPVERGEDPEEYYDHQLVGLRARTLAGEEAGEVVDVVHGGAQELLLVRRPGGAEVLVPFVAAIVPEVDLAGGTVWLDPPTGLLDPDEAENAPPERE